MNSKIKKLHRQLIKTHHNLAMRLGRTLDPEEAEALLREMDELNFRVMMAGRLLFKATTESIDAGIEGILEASADVDQSIKNIAQVRTLVSTVGTFLGLVDDALDLIKAV